MAERRALVNVSGAVSELPQTDILPGVQVLHGWPFPYAVSLSYDKTTRKVTITPTGATFDIWVGGVKYTKTGTVVSEAHPAASDQHFLYYDTDGTLKWSTDPWDMKVVSPVCEVYYDTIPADGIAINELHTFKRNPEWHESQHFAIGTFVRSGLEISGYTLNGDGDAAVTFQVAAGVIVDEDIEFAISTLTDGGPYTVVRRSGATGYTWDSTNTVPYLVANNWIQYNQLVTGSWQMTEAGNQNRWINYFLYATTALDTAKRLFLIPGQALHSTLSAAQSESNASLNLTGLALAEFVCVWKLTFVTGNSYTATGRVRLVEVNRVTNTRGALSVSLTTTTHNLLTGRDATDAHPASAISNVPAGNIAATDVQAALNELDSEKIATSAIGVTVQAYDADIPTVSASQAEMEAGTESALRSMSPLRIKQAIDVLSPGATPSIGFAVSTLFTASGSFVPPVSGDYLVMVCGAGGSGGVAYGATSGATGGGAGGLALKKLTLSSSTTYTVTVGSGGAAVTRSTAGTTAGNAGGNSSFSGSGISTITGNGGGAGNGTTSSNQLDGASGGTASGGDLNFTGGGSGYVTGSGRKATGGGAISLGGTAYASGFASASSTGPALSGGAGVGGASGSATTTTGTGAFSGGGGSGGASANVTATGGTGGAQALPLQSGVLDLRGAGSSTTGGAAGAAGDGGGGGGGTVPSPGGFGAGGGPGTQTSSTVTAGDGGYGGGGGGAAANLQVTSGNGGDGFVLILW